MLSWSVRLWCVLSVVTTQARVAVRFSKYTRVIKYSYKLLMTYAVASQWTTKNKLGGTCKIGCYYYTLFCN